MYVFIHQSRIKTAARLTPQARLLLLACGFPQLCPLLLPPQPHPHVPTLVNPTCLQPLKYKPHYSGPYLVPQHLLEPQPVPQHLLGPQSLPENLLELQPICPQVSPGTLAYFLASPGTPATPWTTNLSPPTLLVTHSPSLPPWHVPSESPETLTYSTNII